MNEKDNIFSPDEPEEERVQPETVDDVDSIAERYSKNPQDVDFQPVEPAEEEKIAEPVQEPQPSAQSDAFNTQSGTTYAYSYVQPPQQPQHNSSQYQAPYQAPYQQWQPESNPPQPTKNKKKGRRIFSILLAAVLVIAAVAIPYSLKDRGNISNGGNAGGIENNTTVNGNAPQLELSETPVKDTGSNGSALSPEAIYEKIAESNVAVMVYKSNNLYTEGTGIVMGKDKTGEYTYIITCAHVISDAGIEVAIQTEDGTRYDADIAGYDERTDIGVLKIKAKGLKAAEFGDSDALKVGSTVYALGNPGGSALFGTFTDGKVSAIGRNITSSIGYDMVCIQHNAAISPGNSGGMLVNEYGQVVGINSAKIAATDYEGISFAIPITQAKEIIDKVIAYGYVPGRAKLGITYVANDNSNISGIYSMAVQTKGLPSGSLVIYSIDKNSSLSGTEAQAGDMIISVNGKDLDKADVLLEEIENSSVGDVITLKLFRIKSVGGKYQTSELEVKATLIEENNTNKEEETTAGVYGSSDNYGYNFNFGF